MTATAEASTDDRVGTRSATRLLLSRPEVGSLIGAAVVLILFLSVAPTLRTTAAIGTVLYQSATIGIMAVAVSLLMIGGEFDLSTGVAATTSGLAASMTAWYFGLNVWVGILVALLLSLSIGAANGWLLMKTGLPSFLVTLGTFFVLQGVNLAVTRIVTGGVASPVISDMQGFASAKKIFGSAFSIGPVRINILVVYWILLTVIASVVLLRTRIGNWIFAVGGDAAAARAVGVPVRATKIGLFMFVGFSAWLLGQHLLFQYSVVQSGEGVGKEFIYIIAAVVGGCLLTGGYGSVIGASVGALVFGLTQLGINYAGWNPDWFRTFLGVMLLLATIVNMYVKRKVDSR